MVRSLVSNSRARHDRQCRGQCRGPRRDQTALRGPARSHSRKTSCDARWRRAPETSPFRRAVHSRMRARSPRGAVRGRASRGGIETPGGRCSRSDRIGTSSWSVRPAGRCGGRISDTTLSPGSGVGSNPSIGVGACAAAGLRGVEPQKLPSRSRSPVIAPVRRSVPHAGPVVHVRHGPFTSCSPGRF